MSYPQDYSGQRSRSSATPSRPGDEADLLLYGTYSSQVLDQQSGPQVDAYRTPQISALPYIDNATSHQTSTHLSSQGESPFVSSYGSYSTNTTADTTLSSPLAGRSASLDYAYVQQEAQSPYVRGATCSNFSNEANQAAPERERRHSVRSGAQVPPTWRRSRRSQHGSSAHQGGNSSRRHRDHDSSVLEDDDEDLQLEGHRTPQIPSDLTLLTQYTDRHIDTTTLAGVGEHLVDRLHHSDAHVGDADPMIFGNSIENGRGYVDIPMPSRSPESLASSMASLTVHQGSAPG